MSGNRTDDQIIDQSFTVPVAATENAVGPPGHQATNVLIRLKLNLNNNARSIL